MADADQNPYLPPAVSAPQSLPALGGGSEPLEDPRGLGWIAIAFIWLVSLPPLVFFFLLVGSEPAKGAIDLGTFKGLVMLGAAATVLMWTYRCAKNAVRLNGRHLGVAPGMAVASYFIPFYNLIGPLLAMNEIVNVTYRYSTRPKVSLVVIFWWWAGWIGANVSLSFGSFSTSRWEAIHLASLNLAALMLTILIVKLSNDQAEIADPLDRPATAPQLRSGALPAIEAGLPIPGIPRLPERPQAPPPPGRPPTGPHPNAPVPRRPGQPEA